MLKHLLQKHNLDLWAVIILCLVILGLTLKEIIEAWLGLLQ